MLERMTFDTRNFPAALKAMSPQELEVLAHEVRRTIIDVVSQNGGHLGASLGAVELIVALHAVFDSPRDRLVFDVGHQAYAHKLLTGRWDSFESLRMRHGLSGFTSRHESEHDPFGAGHAGTALSAAVGMRRAMNAQGRHEDWVVAVVGDGALTAGMSFEALNNAASAGRLLVVLNRNGMSISPTAGALGRWDSARFREFFTLFGFEWLGTVDGHSIPSLVDAFRKTTTYSGPVVVEAITVKGKGLLEAERDPVAHHGVDGSRNTKKSPSFTRVFGEALTRIAEQDPRVVAITAAMPSGTGLDTFARRFPDRFFDVGIAEQHAVTMAAGMAAAGLRPVVAIYSTFLQRAYDQVVHDVVLQGLPVVFAVDRAGIVGQDGPTHHGMFDVSMMMPLPGVVVGAPAGASDMEQMLLEALNRDDGPTFIRYPRDHAPTLELPQADGLRARRLRHGRGPVAVVAHGSMVPMVLERLGDPAVTVWDPRYLKPLDPAMLEDLGSRERVCVVEELPRPELAMEIALRLHDMGSTARVVPVHLDPNRFVPHGTRSGLLEEFMSWNRFVKTL